MTKGYLCLLVLILLTCTGSCLSATQIPSLPDKSAPINGIQSTNWNVSTLLSGGFNAFGNFINQQQFNESFVTCLGDIEYVSKSVGQHELWALKTTIGNLGISVTSVDIKDVNNIKNDTAAIVSFVILGCFVALCVIGTVLEIRTENTTEKNSSERNTNDQQTNNKEHNGIQSSDRIQRKNFISGTKRLLLTFSVRKNGRNILNSKAPPGSLGCLNGIRVLSIVWVILSHFMETLLNQVENKKDFKDLTSTFWFQVIYNGTLAVDTFFFLSGLLVAYQFIRVVKKTKRISGKGMGLFYFHRYFRLTPLYMIVLMIYTNIAPYFTEGVLSSPLTQSRPENCRKFWWTNLLYINNLYHSGRQEMCMLWSWYLANDMQFYIISPIIVIPLSLGYHVIGFLLLFGMVAGQIISGGYIGWSVGDSGLANSHSSEFFEEIYIKPYARMGVYAVGLLLGYIITNEKNMNISKVKLLIGTVLTAACSMLVTYLTYDKYKEDGDGWNSDANIAYETMFRPVWSLVLFWLIYVCLSGYGGLINTILSWNVWIPLSRITYAAYLVHLIILSSFMADLRKFGYLNMFYIVNNYIGILVLTFGVSFILTILVESPFVGLEKVLLNR
ncbi:hypothetical protein LOTGIDRAFT_230381 [Lottia gigantea]|uniref:Acyltransferase 3 domain-containing protein n=1 Tax=Lottia gigantea TaxID=225164 RepID=V4CKW0_LOTGI|nr:hypothetical protein LOTGIDRAFT_230381 [Lottia gigantea]ESP02880.1 hypothetical protein LOTGIDRAFT_230381 [Lottia gigantea]